MKNKKLLLGIGLGVATLGAIYLFNKKKEKSETKSGFGGASVFRKRKVKQDLLEQESSKESLGEMIVDLVKAYKDSTISDSKAEVMARRLSAKNRFISRMYKSGYGEISSNIIELVESLGFISKPVAMIFYKKLKSLGYPAELSDLILEYISNIFTKPFLQIKATPAFIKSLKDLGY